MASRAARSVISLVTPRIASGWAVPLPWSVVMVSVATMKGEVVGFDTNQKFPIAVRLDGDAVNEAWFFDAEDLEVIK